MKLNISSDDINLLIYRYLIENGYCHTAFSFNKEANISGNPYYVNHADKIPPNALVSFMQKAMIYIYLEYHTDDITGDQILCDETFSFFRKHNCFRKLGQSHGLPLSHSMNNSRDRTDNVESHVDKNSTTNEVPSDSLNFDLSKSGFVREDVLETNSSLFQLNHPVYVGPPQRRLSDKWQLYGYHKLFEYLDPNLSTVCHFNPLYAGYILKKTENGPSSLYKLNESGKSSICEILLPHAKLASSESDPGVTTSSRWRHDGLVVFSGHSDGNLNLWSLEGHLLSSVKVMDSPVTSVGFSGTKAYWSEVQPESESPYYVSAGCKTGDVFVYRVENNNCVLVNHFKQSTCVTDLEWQNNNLLSSMTADGTLTNYNVETGESSQQFVQSKNGVPFMEWDYYGRFLAIVDDSDALKVYKPRENHVNGDLSELKGHNGQLIYASWYSGTVEKSSSRICTIAMDKQMIVWDVTSGSSLMSLALDQVPTTVSVCPNDTLVAISSYGNSVKMYALPNLTLSCSFYDKTVPTSISWSSDRQHLVYNVFNLQRSLVVPLNTLSFQSD
uniref:LisH, putative n=1 Tax=Theileria annulata TaxID=5874 RepID=A0A3B0MND4_THEAN